MSGTDQTQTAFTAEDDAVLRAKIALVECINTVEVRSMTDFFPYKKKNDFISVHHPAPEYLSWI